MEPRYTPPRWKEQENGNWMLPALLFVLLLISVGFNIYLYTTRDTMEVRYETRMDSVITQRVNIEKELSYTSTELDKYKGISEKLDSLVNEGNRRIELQEEKIREIMRQQGNSAAANKKLQEELAELKRLKEEYLERIDQLLTENNELREQTRKLDSTVAALNYQRASLEKKVTVASALKAEYVEVKPLKKRNNGKYLETSLARKTNRINICFNVLDNRTAEPGEKTIYVRVIAPDDKVIGNRSMGSSSFMTAETNEELLYTMRKVISYDRNRQEVCTFYEEEEDKQFAAGLYTIEIYVDGYLAASTNYTLR
jgi:uncharacterized protein YeeX (DUF496 family)